MKKQITIVLVLLITSLGSFPIYAESIEKNEKHEIQKWEYKVTRLTEIKGHAQESLNILGEDGWELVAVHGDMNSHAGLEYILKRPKGK